jgi:hypothetical protein
MLVPKELFKFFKACCSIPTLYTNDTAFALNVVNMSVIILSVVAPPKCEVSSSARYMDNYWPVTRNNINISLSFSESTLAPIL